MPRMSRRRVMTGRGGTEPDANSAVWHKKCYALEKDGMCDWSKSGFIAGAPVNNLDPPPDFLKLPVGPDSMNPNLIYEDGPEGKTTYLNGKKSGQRPLVGSPILFKKGFPVCNKQYPVRAFDCRNATKLKVPVVTEEESKQPPPKEEVGEESGGQCLMSGVVDVVDVVLPNGQSGKAPSKLCCEVSRPFFNGTKIKCSRRTGIDLTKGGRRRRRSAGRVSRRRRSAGRSVRRVSRRRRSAGRGARRVSRRRRAGRR